MEEGLEVVSDAVSRVVFELEVVSEELFNVSFKVVFVIVIGMHRSQPGRLPQYKVLHIVCSY